MITSFLLVVALSLDSFLASLAYGAQKIRIPLRSTLLIALIGTSFLGVSIYTAGLFKRYYILSMLLFSRLLSFS